MTSKVISAKNNSMYKLFMALFYKGSYSLFSNFVFKRKGFLPFKTLFKCLLCGVIFSRPPFLSLQVSGLPQP